jgi:hypothetical protein
MLTGLMAARSQVAGEHHDVWNVNADQEHLDGERGSAVLEPGLAGR